MKPLELEIRVSVTTDDPREVAKVRENIARILDEINTWLCAAEVAATSRRPDSRPAPLSAETPGDRANAGIVGDSLDAAIARLAAICPCPKCTAKRARARLNTEPIPPDYDTDTERGPDAKALKAEIVAEITTLIGKMDRLAAMEPVDPVMAYIRRMASNPPPGFGGFGRSAQ